MVECGLVSNIHAKVEYRLVKPKCRSIMLTFSDKTGATGSEPRKYLCRDISRSMLGYRLVSVGFQREAPSRV